MQWSAGHRNPRGENGRVKQTVLDFGVQRLHDARGGIPYGAALAAGAFAVLPYTDVFRLGVST